MNFCSDNVAGVCPEILAALMAANQGSAPSYGDDEITGGLTRRFAEIFEHEVTVFPLVTGTAANALALGTLVPPSGIVYCHEGAHILSDEVRRGGVLRWRRRLVAIGSARWENCGGAACGRMADGKGMVRGMQPSAISLTQATEAGTVYRPEEIGAIAEVARGRGLKLHMDGARFANAVAHLKATPAEITWKAGIDALSFGATKNGAMAAEALIFFDASLAADCAFRRLRGGHLLSKMRFISAQLEAYLADDLWLRNARHANAMASRLATGLADLPGVTLRYRVEANEVFAELPDAMTAHLLARGFQFHRWDGNCIRLVTAFNTAASDVDALVRAAADFAGVPHGA